MILFKKIKWKNFLSTGAHFTEIDFTKSTNTLIVGHNGAGKSTILDALCFVLFNKPYRKINKTQIPNSINNSDCVVEIEFEIGTKKYRVIRGIKPNTFEIYCNGVLVNQDAKAKDYQEHLEKFILKLNYKSFTQVVILGSASFVPFMQLESKDRRTIIEDLLDIEIFSEMNVILSDKLKIVKNNIVQNTNDRKLTAQLIKTNEQFIEQQKQSHDEEVANKRKQIEESKGNIEKITKDIELINKHIAVLQSKIQDKTSIEAKTKKLFQLEAKIESNIKKVKKDIDFYESNDHCPTCKQSIESGFKDTQLTERQNKITIQQKGLEEITEEINKRNERLTEISAVVKHINAHNNEVITHNSTISATQRYISKLLDEIDTLSQKKETLTEDVELVRLNSEFKTLQQGYEELHKTKQYYDFASSLLKDTGIKTKIVRQYLPIMNKLINKYLTAMDFFVNFNINENFEETIKSRHRDEFSYSNFSEGEKLRIDLALLFTWREIARMKNSTNTNLLILDEVFDSSLDIAGTEEFMKLLNQLGTDTNLFVISHKGDQLFDKFRSVIKFEKKTNFSRIVK
jgi:DNA repair exonuclease SbcCD ATPase subunit